jgi:PKD repeat protein
MVTDNNGATDVASVTITAANRPPVSSFDFGPASPKTLEPVTFTSTATDPDGTIASYAWDLNNDGKFADGTTAQVQRSFPLAGTYTVKLKVTDSNGATDIATKTVTVANQPPKASFTTSPATPTTDGPVSLTSTSTDPEGQTLTTAWDLDNNGTFETPGASIQKQYTAPGAYPFKLQVTDPSGASDVATGTITVPNRPPTATVDHMPKNPDTGQAVKFTAVYADPENRIKSIAWDDGSGTFTAGTGPTLTKTYKKPAPYTAPYTVKFRIEDMDGSTTIAQDTVAVGNRPPHADFLWSVDPPIAGTPVKLISTSSDPDTPLDSWQWDLNGDGNYSDAEGNIVDHVFPAPGAYTVGLKVVDSENVSDVVIKTIVVNAPAKPLLTAPITPAGPTIKLLSPFPVVRLAGRISNDGTHLRLFSIEAPPGARVVVICHGRSCPFRLSARSAAAPIDPGKGKVHSSASLRIRQLEKRVLKQGVKIDIYVTKPGTIGKYVEFRFLKRRPPARVDRCLMPSAPNKPVECPS